MQLSAQDDIETLKILRDFLYCNKIFLGSVGADKISRILQAVHRWALVAYDPVLIEFVVERNVVSNSRDLRSLLPVLWSAGCFMPF